MAEFLAENPGATPLPFGLGTHPYFRLPLGPSGTAGECRLSLPVSEEWELLEMNATGRRLGLENADELQRGVSFQDLRLDHVFSGLQSKGGRCVARIDDPNNRRWVRLDFDASFRECVVYTPDSREAICIEPYTCVPDCFRLQTDEVDAGLRILQPGERFQTDFRIELGGRD